MEDIIKNSFMDYWLNKNERRLANCTADEINALVDREAAHFMSYVTERLPAAAHERNGDPGHVARITATMK